MASYEKFVVTPKILATVGEIKPVQKKIHSEESTEEPLIGAEAVKHATISKSEKPSRNLDKFADLKVSVGPPGMAVLRL